MTKVQGKSLADDRKVTAQGSEHDPGSAPQLPDQPVLDKTGFELDDLAKAPVKPPPLKLARKPKREQRTLVAVGLTIAAIGLLCWPIFGSPLGAGVTTAGAVFVLLGVLIRF